MSCYIGPAISPEQFIAEHFFLYLAKGTIEGFDGNKYYTLKAGEYCIVRKNRLVRYNKQKEDNEFEKVTLIFDEIFLKKFQERYSITVSKFKSQEAFFILDKTDLVPSFIHSLMPYYNGAGKIDRLFTDIKREELLLIILQSQPELSGLLFDYSAPVKTDMEVFMNRNYKFNVNIEQFAYLTGRSLSAFKRDFKEIFNDTPGHWLVKKRLQEAYFLMDKKDKKPTEIYIDLGFEDLSHFSFAFKKLFGFTPTELIANKKNTNY